MAAPLIAGNDVAHMSAATRDILLNREVIAVDQDRLGVQGHRVRRDGDREVWVKPLAGGAKAAVLFNRGQSAQPITLAWEDLQLPAGQGATVRDLWAHRDMGVRRGSYAATVPAHGVVMLRVQP